MEKLITLELTKAEVIMLQELTDHIECGYSWMVDTAENLREKALEAYHKPVISQEEYKRRLEDARKTWEGEAVEGFMVRAESSEIQFFYEVEECHA